MPAVESPCGSLNPSDIEMDIFNGVTYIAPSVFEEMRKMSSTSGALHPFGSSSRPSPRKGGSNQSLSSPPISSNATQNNNQSDLANKEPLSKALASNTMQGTSSGDVPNGTCATTSSGDRGVFISQNGNREDSAVPMEVQGTK